MDNNEWPFDLKRSTRYNASISLDRDTNDSPISNSLFDPVNHWIAAGENIIVIIIARESHKGNEGSE